MNLLLAIAIPAMAASTGTFRNARIDALDISVNSFLVGRSTVTGIPRFRNGINCTNSTGNCLVFSDGSTQNTAFTGGGSTISVAASLYGNGQSASNPVGVDSSSVAVYTGGKYPAKDGSLITGLTESQISNLTTDLAAKASSGTNSDVIGFTLPLTSVASVTVQAQGFSVGTASFTVAGGSATVAYKLTAGSLQASSASLTATGIGVYDLTLSSSIQFMNATTGIKWQDGTTSTTASSGSGGGGGISQAYTTISTINSIGAGSIFAQRSTVAFDSTYFTVVDSGTNNASVVSLKQTVGVGQTRQTFLSGSGTYTTPTGVNLIRVRFVGGGAGGSAGQAGTVGAKGGASSFGAVVASSGTVGATYGVGGPGGSSGVNSASGVFASSSVVSFNGGSGCGVGDTAGATELGGCGGNSMFGGGGGGGDASNITGGAAATNTGGGGGGAAGDGGGGGGGAGQGIELVINSPSASYPYVVGAAGAGGTGGSGSGGAGGSGIIVVDEYYPPIAAVAGTLTYYVDPLLSQVSGVKTAFTLSQSPSPQSLIVVLDGILQSSASDYTLSGTAITMTTAPAANSSSFFAQYAVNTSTIPQAMLFNSTDTVSGAKLFQSSATFGYQGALTSTADYSGACIGTAGGCLVAITSVTAQQSAWFYNLIATTTYRVEYELINNSGTSQVGIQFNLDTGANYSSFGYCTNSVAANPLQLISQTSIFLADNSNQVQSGITLTGGFNFKTMRGAPTKVAVYNASSVYPNGNLEGCNNTGYYSGSANLTTMRILSVSQTLTGMVKLYAAPISQSTN